MRRTFALHGRTAAAVRKPAAALQSYDVELIIFRTLSAKATPEDWGMEAGTASSIWPITDEDAQATDAAAVVAPPPTAPTMTFPALPQSKFKLTAIADTLRRSRNYQPLAHFGWTQPGFPRGEPRYMSIDGLVPSSNGLSGQIALARGRYLHLTLELTLRLAGRRRRTNGVATNTTNAQQRTALHRSPEVRRDCGDYAERGRSEVDAE